MAISSSEKDVAPAPAQILLFGDLSLVHFEDQLHHLLHVKNNPLLISFFERVNFALRRLLEVLPAEQQNIFPRFTTLIDLHAKLADLEGTPVLTCFLLSVTELAQALVYYTEGSRTFPPSRDSHVIGPCSGGFAAAAIACSRTLPDLVSNGVEAVLAAFRTAHRSFQVGQSLSSQRQSPQANKSWSVAVSPQGDVDLEQVLEDYVHKEASLRKSPLWISAVTHGKTTTLSGRPSILQDFVSSNASKLKSRYLDIESPFHAAHLFESAEIDEIISHSTSDTVLQQTPVLRLLSSSTGNVVEASTFGGLLKTVVREALQEPIRWDLILSSYRNILIKSSAQKCSILPFSSNASSMVSIALSKENSVEVSVEDVSNTQYSVPPSAPTGHFEDSKIAIVGYSGRFPSAESNEKFWELLKAGRDVHREIPEDRFNWRTHLDPSGKKKNTSKVKHGCFIDEPGVFDTRFFNMSPKEAENTDPAQRLAITTTYEAMEMAGMVRNRTPSTQQDRVGVFFGTTSDDWREVNSGQDVGTYFIPGGNRAFVPGRISYFFRFSGPSLSVDTACSSSFAAIQAACAYLWRGECDTCVAGGTNVLTNPDNFAGLDRGHFLSSTGNCNAFDDEANGYCRSDAVGSVILKRLEDAEADCDPILGVIVGTNTNHCGQTDSITRPHEGDQTSVFKRIMRHADVNPLDISYIEMHGTGTQAGDATEMNSVLSVFVPEHKRTTQQPARPLYLGSAKANIGHAESASGVSSLIKVLMMMKHSEIPLHCGIKNRINHNYPLDLAQRGVNIAMKTTPWLRENAITGKRAAFLNNFSAAGGNTAILLEDAPIRKAITEKDARPLHLIAATAKSVPSLIGNIKSLISFLEGASSASSLAALSYTTTARRTHYNYRVVVSASDVNTALSTLKGKVAEVEVASADIRPIPHVLKKKPQVVIMFSGQGILYAELGKSLYITNAAFRGNILRFNRLAQIQGFPAFMSLIDGSLNNTELQYVSPVVSQLALVCAQMAMFELWKSWGVTPAAVVGHSLGEYAALYAAGVLSAADVIYLVGSRATLLEKHCTPGTHTMLAVKAPMGVVEQLVHHRAGCEIACANQPTGHVIAGPEGEITKIASTATEKGLEALRLNVPFAFHSAQVEPILPDFEKAAAQGVTYNAPQIPVLSPLLARLIPAGEEGTLNGSYLTAASRGRVDFTGALAAAAAAPSEDGGLGFGANERTMWLEIGSHPVCSGMVKGTLGSQAKTVASLRQNVHAYKTLTTALEVLYLAGIDVEWNEYHRDFPASHEVVQLPRYAWDLKKYWIMYRNDFCLTKGNSPPPQQAAIEIPSAAPTKEYKYLSPSAQKVIEESHGPEKSSMTVESDIFDERLHPTLKGHLVNGAALCPSSMYADLALTVAKYMVAEGPNKLPTDTTGFDVADVRVDNPLIAKHTETSHCFRMTANTTWSSNVISMTIFSVNNSGKRTTSHARLDVCITPQQRWLSEWRRNTHFISARMDALTSSVIGSNGENGGHMIKRGMAYKLFGALVDYSKGYQGMSEVVLDSQRLEAVAKIEFQSGSEGFGLNPMWIDSLGHIAGFIMNANDGVDSKNQVYINHGWERMRIAEPIQADKVYRSYNRMQLVEKTTYQGDTYIMEGGRIVAIFEGVTFQGVPKRSLDFLLPGKTGPTAAKAVSTAPTSAAPAHTPAPVAKPKISAPAPAPHPAKAKTASNDNLGVMGRIKSLICQEVGLQASDLKPESDFAELGVDSLLSLTITSKIQEELGMELPSSLFIDCPTFGELQAKVGGNDDDDSTESTLSSSSSSDDESHETPLTSGAVSVYQDDPSASRRTHATLVLRQIIAEETSVAIEELKPSTGLADVGVDSLLGLNISGKLQELLQVDIAGNALMELETVQDVEVAICKAMGIDHLSKPSQPPSSGEPSTDHGAPRDAAVESNANSSLPQATSMLLSGSPQTAKVLLFLFPDGSGSASSYAALAPVVDKNNVAVYGLNCPWRKTGFEMTRLGINMSTMVSRYVMEVRRLIEQQHRHVAVSFGGWSAGGILAFEAVRQLQQQPDPINISQLILFDSPNPIGLQNPPKRMYDFFNSLGIFGGGKNKTPEWLQQHFDAFLRVLDDYEPSPLPNAPPSLIVYARDGICKDPDGPKMETYPDDPREMLWLLNNRTDFSGDGWRSIVGRDNLDVEVLDEVNHFTLMDAGPKMKEAGQTVSRFCLNRL